MFWRSAVLGVGVTVALFGSAYMRSDSALSAEIQTAMLPTNVAPLERVADLPRLLSAADVIRYRRVFKIQEGGDWAAADEIIAAIEDRILMGHVLYQRYMHPTKYTSRFDELAAWQERYADHPGASRLYRLALKRRPKGSDRPRKPIYGYLDGIGEDEHSNRARVTRLKRSPEQRETIRALGREFRAFIRAGEPVKATQILVRPEIVDWLSNGEYDLLRTALARGFFAVGRDAEALKYAAMAANRSGDAIPMSHWAAGLAAWRLGDMRRARRHFQTLAEAETDDTLIAAGAFWAARVHKAEDRPVLAKRMLDIAGEYGRTFYGLLARRVLGESPNFNWDQPRLAESDIRALLKSEPARRAISLVEVGQSGLAAKEIRKLYPRAGEKTARMLLRLTELLDLPSLEIRIGSKLSQIDGRRHDQALYPVPDWFPDTGDGVDRALVLAVVRQESGFDPEAKSPAGARGLMQLMPRTASYVDGDATYHRGAADQLYIPELNLTLGQRYLRYLLDDKTAGENMLFVLAAYNGGPGTLRKWLDSIEFGNDPLLFLESVPSLETRRYMRRVMTNLWVYRDRLDQSAVSLDDLAAGQWPAYRGQDDRGTLVVDGGY